MNCYYHPGVGSVAKCASCGKEICSACTTEFNNTIVCRDCADKLRKEAPAPAPESNEPMAGQKPVTPAEPAPAPKIGDAPPSPPHVPASPPVVPSSPTPTVPAAPAAPTVPATKPSEPPRVPEQMIAAPAEKKNALLALLLSVIVPGLGQLYNGQVKKGIILAVGYILVWLVVIILSNYRGWLCCVTFWIPFVVIIYAAYDAYATTKKANSGKRIKDWLA